MSTTMHNAICDNWRSMLADAGYAVMEAETEGLFKEALNLRPVDVMFKGPKDSVWGGLQVSIADPTQVRKLQKDGLRYFG